MTIFVALILDMRAIRKYSIYFSLIFLISCHAYKQNIMFKTKKGASYLSEKVDKTEKNYVITPNDYLELKVYTNNGELIIDPNYGLMKEYNVPMNQNSNLNQNKPKYLVKPDGTADLPMLGNIDLKGMTLYDATQLLEKMYSQFYEEPFVYLKLVNKRVILLKGEDGYVIPLDNENMTVFEILALGGGVNNYSKAFKVRIIRGDLSNPEVFVLDLSTIEGIMKANVKVQPNDIVYVEPVRKVITESIRDIVPVLALFSTVITLILVIKQK